MNPLLLAAALAAVALALSIILLVKSLTGGGLPGCGAGSGCDEVTRGRWARIGTVPVALFGVMAYLTLAASALAAYTRGTAVARNVLLTASAVAVGGAAWFILLQVVAIRRLCRWCMYTHTVAAAAGTIVIVDAWRGGGPLALPLIIATGLVALLVVAQLMSPARSYQIDTTPAKHVDAVEEETDLIEQLEPRPPLPATPDPSPVIEEPEADPPPSPGTPGEGPGEGRAEDAEDVISQAIAPAPPPAESPAAAAPQPPQPQPQPQPQRQPPHQPPPRSPSAAPSRRITAVRGAISLSPHLWPVLGSRDATYILIDQFDYTCHLCRELHDLMLRAVERWPTHVAVLMMPVPLDKTCNPALQYQSPEHVNACEYARHALAVFRAAPGQFPAYDHWLFETPRPRTVADMKAKAAELIGPAPLAAALADPWLNKRMNEAIAIFDAVGRGSIPKLLLPDSVLTGQLPTADRMFAVLRQQLKLPD